MSAAADIISTLAIAIVLLHQQWRGLRDRLAWPRIINWNWRPRLSLPTRAAP
jgi:hypothetical protein